MRSRGRWDGRDVIPNDRRKHPRSPSRIRVQVRSGSFAARGWITDFSEDGLFVEVDSNLAPGTTVSLRFEHPRLARMVTTRGLVAGRRRDAGATGLQVFLKEPLSSHGSDRRREPRTPVDLPVEVRVGSEVVVCKAFDLSAHGAGLEIDLNLSGTVPRRPGVSRAAPSLARRLRPGARLILRYRNPDSTKVETQEVVVARNIVAAGTGCRLGVSFRPLPVGAPTEVERTGVTITGGMDLDVVTTMELEMRALLRGVSWTSTGALSGAGRLVLAGPKKLLVACHGEVPLMRSIVVVGLETLTGEPLGIHTEVIRSESGLVGGVEPGFIGQVNSFSNDGSANRYRKLVRWLHAGRTAG